VLCTHGSSPNTSAILGRYEQSIETEWRSVYDEVAISRQQHFYILVFDRLAFALFKLRGRKKRFYPPLNTTLELDFLYTQIQSNAEV
jgi:hypothetical protein